MAILAGVVAAGAAYFLERTIGFLIFDRFYETYGDSYGFIIADAFFRTGLIEEAVRYLALTSVAKDAGNSRRDSIRTALLVGTGFWLAETILYVGVFGLHALAKRFFPAWGVHMALSVFAGCALSAEPRKKKTAFLFAAVALHGLYDTVASLPEAGILTPLAAVCLIATAVIIAMQQDS